MRTGRQYNSGPALRTALEERLKRISREEAVDLQRLRRQVAFDRFLAKFFRHGDEDWVLKGGYAMELRFHTARASATTRPCLDIPVMILWAPVHYFSQKPETRSLSQMPLLPVFRCFHVLTRFADLLAIPDTHSWVTATEYHRSAASGSARPATPRE